MGRSLTPTQTPALTTSHTAAAARQLMNALDAIERMLGEARAAGEQITFDAASLRRLFDSDDATVAQSRVLQLEQELAEDRERFRAERDYLIDQQDRFVGSLLEEHEVALKDAMRERDAVLAQVKCLQQERTSNPPESAARASESDAEITQLRTELTAARATIERLTAERERSLEMLRRVHAQRDASQRELAQLRRKQFATETPTVAPPPPAARTTSTARSNQDRRPTDPAPPPSSSNEPARRSPLVLNDLDAAWDRETYPAPPPAMDPGEQMPQASAAVRTPQTLSSVQAQHAEGPRGINGGLRHSPPPIELSAAVLGTRAPDSDKRNSSQPIRSKPALHQRPLIGYSVRPASAESVKSARLGSSKPPR